MCSLYVLCFFETISVYIARISIILCWPLWLKTTAHAKDKSLASIALGKEVVESFETTRPVSDQRPLETTHHAHTQVISLATLVLWFLGNTQVISCLILTTTTIYLSRSQLWVYRRRLKAFYLQQCDTISRGFPIHRPSTTWSECLRSITNPRQLLRLRSHLRHLLPLPQQLSAN